MQKLTAFVRDTGNAAGRVVLQDVAERALAMRRYSLRKFRIDASVAGQAEASGTARNLLQVVLNLVMNAEDALVASEGATLRVVVAADGDRAQLSVQDNGPGISREAMEHLYLWPPPSHPGAGTLGIGLLVSRALVADDAGTLSVERGPLGGTVATLSLPRSRG